MQKTPLVANRGFMLADQPRSYWEVFDLYKISQAWHGPVSLATLPADVTPLRVDRRAILTFPLGHVAADPCAWDFTWLEIVTEAAAGIRQFMEVKAEFLGRMVFDLLALSRLAYGLAPYLSYKRSNYIDWAAISITDQGSRPWDFNHIGTPFFEHRLQQFLRD